MQSRAFLFFVYFGLICVVCILICKKQVSPKAYLLFICAYELHKIVEINNDITLGSFSAGLEHALFLRGNAEKLGSRSYVLVCVFHVYYPP